MAENTPESDLGSIECFQNYTAPEVFIQGLAGIVNQQDVEAMIRAQKQMLQRFEKTNEMLTNCNALSVNRLKTAGTEFKKHTQLLLEMKKDLDNIFKRIRVLKNKLSSQYPEGFEAQQQVCNDLDVEETFSAACASKHEESPDLPPHNVSAGTLECDTYSGGYSRLLEEASTPEHHQRVKRGNSSSTDSPNGNSNNESSPCTSDTG
ncbi:hypothetical protein R5R35_013286 [Gryllus longicercus]|uniref:KxDL domain-containing protein n=1 Tax=Gryllus longicercus TaxID=2509291 RepID=A0AAN9V3V0_9ORTH